MDSAQRDEYYKYWKRAVTRTFDWFEADEEEAQDGPDAPGRAGGGFGRSPARAYSRHDHAAAPTCS